MSQQQTSQSNTPQPLPTSDSQGMVTKCVRFFKTLIQLSQQPEQQQPVGVFFIAFISSSWIALKSQAQPHLLPFLHKTLPYLRAAMRSGEVTIEGVVPPQGMMVQPTQQMEAPSPQQQQVHMPMQHQQHIVTQQQPPSQAQQHIHAQPVRVHCFRSHYFILSTHSLYLYLLCFTLYLFRQLQEGALESALLRPPDIMSRITQCMNEMCYVDEEVLVLISDAAEYRLREILGELAVLAEHRMEPLRLNSNYGPVDDTRRQLRFLEDIDRQQEEQRENREKEALIRMSKSKGIAKDTIERAKEMQRADAEAKRNRDANAAAIAALSSVSGGGVSGTVHRPRTVRVNIRDLHVLVNKDSRFRSGPPSESL
ncbi:unnamed protein product [Heligmosomoides polygyrus]|uniref:TAFH domain-containing protein n=1 Tax=Heligmosomoides polygyrus TaxID=6339 RepID=A0A183FST6_HELPZ|nr:unnamed protein product [Heligmosomoides polygyrus]